MLQHVLRATALVVVLASASTAAEYDFVVTNKTDDEVNSIFVQNGKVNNFKRVPSNGERSMTITLPDGVCMTRIQVGFSGSEAVFNESYDACNSGGLDLIY